MFKVFFRGNSWADLCFKPFLLVNCPLARKSPFLMGKSTINGHFQ